MLSQQLYMSTSIQFIAERQGITQRPGWFCLFLFIFLFGTDVLSWYLHKVEYTVAIDEAESHHRYRVLCTGPKAPIVLDTMAKLNIDYVELNELVLSHMYVQRLKPDYYYYYHYYYYYCY